MLLIYNILSDYIQCKKKLQKIISHKVDLHSGESKIKEFPQEIRDELLSRVKSFFSEDKFKKIENAFVIVVGLGGVGSHAANMLARSGIGKIRLIDFDQVTLSSLNRHANANMKDVGLSKAETVRNKLLEVVPWCNIEAVTAMFREADAPSLLSGHPTYVLDCIDDIQTKGELIAYCKKNNIEILTSMGAGGKADPTKLRIAPLGECINDPLAAKIKWKLKKSDISHESVMSVFSIEKPLCDLLPLQQAQYESPQDYGVADYLRLRVMPVLGTSPSIFGQAMAAFVLCAIGERRLDPDGQERMTKNLKHKMRQSFRNDELSRFGCRDGPLLDDDEMELLVAHVWRNRCSVTGRRFGGHSTLLLTRWRVDRPAAVDNVVLLMPEQHKELLALGPDAAFDLRARRAIEERLEYARQIVAADGPQQLVDPRHKASPASVQPSDRLVLRFGLVAAACFSAGYLAAGLQKI